MKLIKTAMMFFCFLALNFAASANADSMQDSALLSLSYSVNGVVPEEQAKLIKKAVNEELSKQYLTCTTDTHLIITNYSGAKMLKQFIIHDGTKVSISENFIQSVLTFERSAGTGQIIVKVATTSDFKKILSINAVRYKIETKTVSVGTLINPKYEEVVTRKVDTEISCRAKVWP